MIHKIWSFFLKEQESSHRLFFLTVVYTSLQFKRTTVKCILTKKMLITSEQQILGQLPVIQLAILSPQLPRTDATRNFAVKVAVTVVAVRTVWLHRKMSVTVVLGKTWILITVWTFRDDITGFWIKRQMCAVAISVTTLRFWRKIGDFSTEGLALLTSWMRAVKGVVRVQGQSRRDWVIVWRIRPVCEVNVGLRLR